MAKKKKTSRPSTRKSNKNRKERIGIIDLGTNSVRFDIHELSSQGKVITLYREKMMVRLGQGVFTSGQLDPGAIERTGESFEIFSELAEKFSVQRVLAIGTSALREAVDGPFLIEYIQRKFGIRIQIISGREEARLIALGILSHERLSKDTNWALVDIGGGSTEISLVQKGKVIFSKSFPLGTARIQQVFLKQTPPSHQDLMQLRQFIRKVLSSPSLQKAKGKQRFQVVGSSGTIKTLAKIGKRIKGQDDFSISFLEDLVVQMEKMTPSELTFIPGMDSKRADMILGGAILLEECANALGASKIKFTEYSLRDGILEEERIRFKESERGLTSISLEQFVTQAMRLRVREPQVKNAQKLTDILFDRLKPFHRLPDRMKIYLSAAAVMRSTGESISVLGHPKHSAYIIKNTGFPFVESWESELIAFLVEHHKAPKLVTKGLGSAGGKIKKKDAAKLLGLLVLVDALDADRYTSIDLKKVDFRKGELTLKIAKGSGADLESTRVKQRKKILHQALGKKIGVVRV